MKNIYLIALFPLLALTAACNKDDEPQESQRDAIFINGHEAVDLGLSVKWSSCNFGAESETDNGYKYILTKPPFRTDCIFYNPYSHNDIVSNSWGDEWRIPTKEEVDELINKCIFEIVFFNGIKIAKISAANGNYIYLPYFMTSYGIDTYYISSSIFDWDTTPKALYGFAIEERRITPCWTELRSIEYPDNSDLSPLFIRPVAK